MSGDGFYTYNSQLVSYFSLVNRLHNAEFWPEDAFSLYYLVQEASAREEQAQPDAGPVLPAVGHAVAGAIAAALAKALVYPIETMVTRMQVQKQLKGHKEAPSAASDADLEYTSLSDAARKMYKNEGGLAAFYPGLGADVSKGVVDTFLFFLAYTTLRNYQAKRDNTKHLSVLKELSVGIAAGCFSKAITTPIQNIVTRQQTAALIATRDPASATAPEQSDKLTIKDIAVQIRSEKGIMGFWSGYRASIILTLNPAVTFAVDNALRRLLPKSQRENPSPQTTFLLAAFSKVLATTLTYPIMLAKSRAQASTSKPEVSDEKVPEYLSEREASNLTGQRVQHNARKAFKLFAGQVAILASLRRVYRQEGLRGLYAGLEGEVLKGFLQHGLTMTVKESVHGGVVQTYYALLKLTSRWPDHLQQAQADAGALVQDAGERVGNVSVTVAEGAKQLGRKAVGGEKE